LSVISTVVEAGLLLSAGYIFSRSLWLPIFLHFAWDFAEPGVFGAINPGITIDQSLLTSKIDGPLILTGGQLGPQNSIQAFLLCAHRIVDIFMDSKAQK
jgi:membrane protease YdiL (CAAX protease family)